MYLLLYHLLMAINVCGTFFGMGPLSPWHLHHPRCLAVRREVHVLIPFRFTARREVRGLCLPPRHRRRIYSAGKFASESPYRSMQRESISQSYHPATYTFYLLTAHLTHSAEMHASARGLWLRVVESAYPRLSFLSPLPSLLQAEYLN